MSLRSHGLPFLARSCSRFLSTFLTLLAMAVLFRGSAPAQQLTGTITGTVTDASGSAVPGAQVNLLEVNTGQARTMQANDVGNFRFLLLPTGVYRVDVTQQGFKAVRRDGIIIEADRSLAVPIALEVGSVVEVVQVEAGTPLLEPNTSSLGTVMDKQKVDDLPLNGRNPMGLANLVPTVRGIGFFGGQVLSSWRMAAVSIGGGSPLHNDFLVDGIAATKVGSSGAQVYPTVESTQEFKILTNAMSAEFGRTGGGIVSIVTKSGTNAFHGNLFEYLRNDNLNANEFFSNKAGRARPTLAWNQFGGSIGGPIKRNKVFFFTNYEGFRERRVTQAIQTSATRLERAGDFSDTRNQAGALLVIYDPASTVASPGSPGGFVRTPFAGNRLPANRINAISTKALSFYPEPNVPGLPFTRAQNLFLQGAGPIDRNTMTGKVDYNISSSRRLSGRYTWDKLDWQFPLIYKTVAEPDGRKVLIPRNSASLNYTDTLTPTLLMDAKIGFSRENEHFVSASEGFDITTLGFPAEFQRQSSVASGARFPTFSVADMAPLGGSTSAGSPSITTLSSLSLTKLSGSHTVKFGGEHRFYSINPYGRGNSSGTFAFNRGFTQGPNPLLPSNTAGYGVASLLLGNPASGSVNLTQDRTQSLKYNALFLQDDWKVTNNLTLNLGVRWEYESPMTDRYNVLASFDPNVTSPIRMNGQNLRGGLVFPGTGGLSRNLTEPDYNDWAPRFGFAYRASQKMVFRGGYGLLYIPTHPFIGPTTTGFSFDTPMVATQNDGLTPFDQLSNPFPNGITAPLGASLGALTGVGTSIAGQLRDVDRGYSQQWNTTLQYEPWNNWLLEVAWVGNKGTRTQGASRQLNVISDANRTLGTQLAQSVPNPFLGSIASGPLAGATITRLQSLLPYPQFTGVNGGYSYLHNSIYHALAVKVEKRFSQGFSILMAYTKSKLIDDGNATGQIRPGGNNIAGAQNWLNLRAERSKAAEDVPQRMVLTALWALPFGRDGHIAKRLIIGGWQMNPIMTLESGTPLSLTATVPGGGNRPDVVAGQQAKLENPTLERWFNTAAFTQPQPFALGTVSRTLPNVHSDSVFNIDVSLFKDFQIREGMKVQFRAEAFNMTNTPTFASPGTSVNAATFGVVTATAFTPKPREVQLALKLIF